MRLASLHAPGRGETNRLLAELAQVAQTRGLTVIGTVQINTERAGSEKCDMDVRVLPEGPLLRISQNLGEGSRGCRLDPASLEEAVERTAQALARGADLMIVNKFGKHEAEGRGFRALIGEALAQEVPVIVGLNGLNAEAFASFGEGLAEALAPEPEALLRWLDAAVQRSQSRA